MSDMKKSVIKYLSIITIAMLTLILAFSVISQILGEQRQERENSKIRFVQIGHILRENQKELDQIQEEYADICLTNAEAIAYMIQNDPLLLGNVEKLRKIAEFIGVDEIHIFDTEGRIFSGTHPEYYNMTFNSGTQIRYFMPMLEDKTLKLVQDIAPNTAEKKLMQYSALWSENGEFIVQVGMEPVNVMKMTEKNELSYIFGLLKASEGVDLYAVDIGSGEIKGATNSELVGRDVTKIGLNLLQIRQKGAGFHAKVNGVDSYCVFTPIDTNLIGRVISNDVLYAEIPAKVTELVMALVLVAVILVLAVGWYINHFVIKGIDEVNSKLRKISNGNLEEKVDVQISIEFSELSNHINDMVKSLLYNTQKMSYVLNKTNLHIGVYEYNEYMRAVRFTDYVPKILGLTDDNVKVMTSDCTKFRYFMDKLRENSVPGEDDVYRLDKNREIYIKVEEIVRDNDVMGIVIDATEEILRRRQIEEERDIDLLTGLYNRRGLENRLSALFAENDKLGYGALIMIDADGLKGINDVYGHDMGDAYLKKIAEVISSVGTNGSIAARQGGDEFVLFLYNYPTEEKLLENISKLESLQNDSTAQLNDKLTVPARFSIGYSFTKGESDYNALIKQADDKMYANKSERKRRLREENE